MDILEIVQRWLAQQGISVQVDTLGVVPENSGLYPQGRQELWRREDVLGGVTVRARYTFLLRFVAAPGEDFAGKMLRLQENAGSQPPVFGENQAFRAENGKCTKKAATGLWIYELRLIAEREESL